MAGTFLRISGYIASLIFISLSNSVCATPCNSSSSICLTNSSIPHCKLLILFITCDVMMAITITQWEYQPQNVCTALLRKMDVECLDPHTPHCVHYMECSSNTNSGQSGNSIESCTLPVNYCLLVTVQLWRQ